MKKIFTLLSGLLLASGLTANAQTKAVEFTLYDEYWNEVGQTMTVDLSFSEDGKTATISNFINSGKPVSFSCENIVDGANALVLTSEKYVNKTSIYPMVGTDYLHCSSIPKEGEETINFYDVAIYDGYWWEDSSKMYEGTYIYKYNGEYEGWYDISFYVYGGVDVEWTDNTDWYIWYGQVYLNSDEPSDAVKVHVVNMYANIVDDGITADSEEADAFDAEITKDENGNYILSNFLDSEESISFKFEKPNVLESSNITLSSEVNADGVLLGSNGKPFEGFLYNYKGDGTWSNATDITIFADQGYSYVVGLSPAKYDYDYLAVICAKLGDIKQWNSSTNSYDTEVAQNAWVNIAFYFNEPKSDDSSAVEGIEIIEEVEGNAPVEYYNLNGQKVQNPANGIFIRKQGAKTSKVIVR